MSPYGTILGALYWERHRFYFHKNVYFRCSGCILMESEHHKVLLIGELKTLIEGKYQFLAALHKHNHVYGYFPIGCKLDTYSKAIEARSFPTDILIDRGECSPVTIPCLYWMH